MNNLLETKPVTGRSTESNSMVKRIVLATDLSEQSSKTTQYAVALARHFGASLTLVHVFEPEEITFTTPQPNEAFEIARREAELTLLCVYEEIRQIHCDCEMEFRVGEPLKQIALMASTLKADLVVIGSHRLNFVQRMFATDEAARILHATGCPVLVYREGTASNPQISTGRW